MSQDPLTALAQDMATATSWIVGEIAGVLDGTLRITTTPDFTNSRFVTSYAIVFAASSILMVVLWLLAVIKRAVAGVGPLRAMSEATGPLWLAVAASAFTPAAIAGLVSITDALTDAVATPIGSPTGYLKSLASQIQPDSKPFLSIILDLLVFMAALMLATELIIRAALLYMAVALAPAFYAGLVDRGLWHHIKSWAGAILAFDFVKPITILMLALAKGVSSALSTTPSTNLSSLMIGMTILYSCVYLSTRVYQFVPFIGDELNSWGMRDLTFRALNRANRLTKPARRAAGQAARTARATAADRMRDGINAHANRPAGVPGTATDPASNTRTRGTGAAFASGGLDSKTKTNTEGISAEGPRNATDHAQRASAAAGEGTTALGMPGLGKQSRGSDFNRPDNSAPRGGDLNNPPAADANRAEINWPDNDGALGERRTVTLERGTLIDRYGGDQGYYVSPQGTDFGMRSMPPNSENGPYSMFVVNESLTVEKATIAPWFGQPGLGVQYELPATVQDLMASGSITRVFLAEDINE